MPQHGFDKNLIRRIFFFNIQRGDPLDFQKRFLQCRGVIFQKKNSAFLEVSQICQRMISEGTCKSIYLYCLDNLDIHFVVRRKIEKVTKLYPQLPTNILFHL